MYIIIIIHVYGLNKCCVLSGQPGSQVSARVATCMGVSLSLSRSQVLSNSRYFVFLLGNGRVCRLPVTSSAEKKRGEGSKGWLVC